MATVVLFFLGTNIFQNIFFSIQQKKERACSYTDLEQLGVE